MRGGKRTRLVWVRVAVPVVGTVLLFLVAAFAYYLPAQRESLLQQKREALRDLVSTAWSILDIYRARELAGELDGNEARRRASVMLSRMRFGKRNKDYFWISDLEPRLLMHPYRADMEGGDLRRYADRDGMPLLQAFVRVTAATGEGFIQYQWQWQDDPARVEPKLSLVRRYEPWGWVVGTGVYIDDVEAEAARQAARWLRSGMVVFLLASLLALASILQGRQADIRLRRSRDKVRAIFNQSFQFMAFLDPQGRLLEVNNTALALHALRAEDVLGKFFWDTPWWDHSAEAQQQLRRAVAEAVRGRAVRWQLCGPDVAGELLDVAVSIKPALDSEGRVFGIIAEGQDVTEQVLARRDRERTLAELEARNQELERVAYVVSHDLRNPLVTIKGFLGVLQEALRQRNEERAGLALQRIDAAADRIGGLLRDLLTLFRLGHLEGAFEEVDLDVLLHEVELELVAELRARGGEVRRLTPLPRVTGDRERLREVLYNLLENACSFARPDLPLVIEVGARETAREYECFVRDNGMGIRAAYLEKIFDLFEQLAPDGRGTGVGLTLVRRIIERHGGTVWAESGGEGQGVEVRFRLPKQPPGASEHEHGESTGGDHAH